MSKRQDDIRDFLAIKLNNVCVDVQVEPHLLPVTKEQFKPRSANTSDEARLDIGAKGFWRQGETAFFDVRVTHVNSKSSQNLKTTVMSHKHEQAKKLEYLERTCLEIDNVPLTSYRHSQFTLPHH